MTVPQRIMVIDDDRLVCSTIENILGRAGYEVKTEQHGKNALRLLAGWPADLVITDILMPEMEGFETILRVRQARPRTTILAVSGGGLMGHRQILSMARRLGATEILAKPFEPEALLAAAARCLSGGEPAARLDGS